MVNETLNRNALVEPSEEWWALGDLWRCDEVSSSTTVCLIWMPKLTPRECSFHGPYLLSVDLIGRGLLRQFTGVVMSQGNKPPGDARLSNEGERLEYTISSNLRIQHCSRYNSYADCTMSCKSLMDPLISWNFHTIKVWWPLLWCKCDCWLCSTGRLGDMIPCYSSPFHPPFQPSQPTHCMTWSGVQSLSRLQTVAGWLDKVVSEAKDIAYECGRHSLLDAEIFILVSTAFYRILSGRFSWWRHRLWWAGG